MEINTNWLQLPSNKIANAFVVILCAVCPGIITLYAMDKAIFLSIDTIKMLLLCLAISGPIWAINYFVIDIKGMEGYDLIDEDERGYISVIVPSLIAAILTSFTLYIPSILKLFEIINTKGAFILLAFGIEVLCIIIYKTLFHIEYEQHKKEKEGNPAP